MLKDCYEMTFTANTCYLGLVYEKCGTVENNCSLNKVPVRKRLNGKCGGWSHGHDLVSWKARMPCFIDCCALTSTDIGKTWNGMEKKQNGM